MCDMIRLSELAGLFAAVAIFLGTLVAAQSLVWHDAPDGRHAELVDVMN
jgi:hypothetical protein